MSLDSVLLIAAVILVGGAGAISLAAYRRYRGPRVVSCPADGRRAAVSVDATQAALTVVAGGSLRVESCSFWPARAFCGQTCLAQVDEARTSGAAVRILKPWYAGRKCVLCGGEFSDPRWCEFPPTLMDRRGQRRPWFELPPDEIALGLSGGEYRAVCWRCYVLEGLRADDARSAWSGGSAPPS